MEEGSEDITKNLIKKIPQLNFLHGYKSLIESYNLMSQSLSRHVELNQSSYILSQVQELTAENNKIKQENLYFQELVHKLAFENSQLRGNPLLPVQNTTVLPEDLEKIPKFTQPPTFSQDLIEKYQSDQKSLKTKIQELSIYKTQFLEIEQKNIELTEKIADYKTKIEELQEDFQDFKSKSKKTEDLLEVAKLHRDLLKSKVEKIRVVGNSEKQQVSDLDDILSIEKRLKILEDRLRGTEDVEKYVKKYNDSLETIKQANIQIKNLQEKLETLTEALKTSEKHQSSLKSENIKLSKSPQSPAVLSKLITLLYKHQSPTH